MTELEKIQYTKSFIDKMANGINPLDNTYISENDLIHHERISRCLFYVSDILRQVIENGGIRKRSNKNRLPFSITDRQLLDFPFSDSPIPVSHIREKLNAMIDTNIMKPMSYRDITDWLVSIDLLQEETDSKGKNVKRPTEKAASFGISLEERQGQYGVYHVVVYDRKAQEFIIDNIQAIISRKNTEQKEVDEDGYTGRKS